MSLNKVTLIGRLGKDPEVKNLTNGSAVANFSVATSEKWKDKRSGETQEKTEWHNIVVWNEKTIEFVEKYLSKGDLVYIEGKIQTRKWQDSDGKDRYSTEIVIPQFAAIEALQKLNFSDSNDDRGDDRGGRGGRSSDRGSSKSRSSRDDDRGGDRDDDRGSSRSSRGKDDDRDSGDRGRGRGRDDDRGNDRDSGDRGGRSSSRAPARGRAQNDMDDDIPF
jgi:single-strand DNA-binding protein